MIKITYLFLLLSLSSKALACQCVWQGSFNEAYKKADLIVSGKIVTHKGNAADLLIGKLLNGKEFLETIRLWGDTGNLCRPNIYHFPENSEWVLALNRIDKEIPGGFNPNTPSFSYGRIGDYELSNCGAYWLKLEHGFVTGNLINGPRWDWQQEKMNPVRIELIEAYIQGKASNAALIEASKPQEDLKQLMQSTKSLLEPQI